MENYDRKANKINYSIFKLMSLLIYVYITTCGTVKNKYRL